MRAQLAFVGSQYLFSAHAGWSGQQFALEVVQQTYNLFYTSLPTLLLGVFDQDVPASVALAVPELYTGARWNRTYLTRSAVFGVSNVALACVRVCERETLRCAQAGSCVAFGIVSRCSGCPPMPPPSAAQQALRRTCFRWAAT